MCDTMLTQNSGDLRKAKSNHWFFAYLPDSVSLYRNNRLRDYDAVGSRDSRNSTTSNIVERCLPYSFYGAFVAAAVLALYTQIAIVHPVHTAWWETTTEAFGFQHVMARNQHERLARKFHLLAHSDVVSGVQARVKAAHGIHDSIADKTQATALFQLEKEN